MTDPFHDYHDRRSVPRPVFSRSDRINTATIGTAIAFKIHQRFVSAKNKLLHSHAPIYGCSRSLPSNNVPDEERHNLGHPPISPLIHTIKKATISRTLPKRWRSSSRQKRASSSGTFLVYLMRFSLIPPRLFNLIFYYSGRSIVIIQLQHRLD